MEKIRTYKMTHATGFAPNHDCGILTLATCKPGVREKAKIGDWIAGFTSTAKMAGGTQMGKEKLIYLMKVTDKMTFDEYWKKYPKKRPDFSDLGDNIYHKNENGEYVQVPNKRHFEWDIKRDTSSDKVLISTEFRYFGKENSLEISDFREFVKIPYGPAMYGYISENEKVAEFIDFVMQQETKSDIDYSAVSRNNSSSCSEK